MRAVRINFITILGAILGVITFFLPWIYSHSGGMFSSYGTHEYLFDFFSGYVVLWLIPLTFIIGTFLSFISPLGSIFQIPVILMLLSIAPLSHGAGEESSMAAGWYLAVISCGVILFSMMDPPLRTDNGVLIEPSKRRRTFEIIDEEGGGITRDEINSLIERKKKILLALNQSLRRTRSIAIISLIILLLLATSIASWWSPTSQIWIRATGPGYASPSFVNGPPSISIYIDGNLSFSETNVSEWPEINRIINVVPGLHNVSIDHNAFNPIDGVPEEWKEVFLTPFEETTISFGYFYL